MHCERIEITQAHRPGGITPRRGFLLPFCVGAVVWVYAVRRCAAALPSYLKRIFDRFFQGIRGGTPPGRGLAVRLQALHQFTTEPAPPAAHRRHSIHQQNQPQQAPADSTSKDTTARNSTEPPTPRKYSHFITHFQVNFSDFPGLVLFRPA